MRNERIIIEVDGREIEARKGAMLIEATDAAGIYIPRFCYHKHLSIAANCRMCLVEIERAPKPLPACAAPVTEGMKVFTRSKIAVDAQHSTMEFLLINHPLDCPICDQGGECELQDLAMGYGGDVSRYTERKRVVRDKNIGPLVQTDMTRCIHCTRCVRFGEEIAGLRELGATGRSEHMEIGTYIEQAMTSELSGNVIDLCPVGALTSKPYRYSARAWELKQRDGIAPHDCLGSNVHFHIKDQIVKRIVPRERAAINQTWLSDGDRYSYEGMNHLERLNSPRVKREGRWTECDWGTALKLAADNLGRIAGEDAQQLAALASPSSTTEEFYLLQRLMRGLGSHNVDHRLRQIDFSDQNAEPRYPGFESISALESADAVLLLGSFPRHEQPLINLRLRNAALSGAAIMQIDTCGRAFNFDLYLREIVKPSRLAGVTAGVAAAAAKYGKTEIDAPLDKLVDELAVDGDSISAMAEKLSNAERAVVLVGATIHAHSERGALCQIASALAKVAGASVGYLVEGANAAGAWLAGAVPHRGPGGRSLHAQGYSVRAMIENPRRAYLLLGVEPDLDCADAGGALAALETAEFVVAISAYENDAIAKAADVILPMAIYGENEGSFVNAMGEWQRFAAAVKTRADTRPAWKILRVLGNELDLAGFDAVTCEQVTREIESLVGDTRPSIQRVASLDAKTGTIDGRRLELIVEIPLYSSDPLLRHAPALQEMPQSGDDRVRISAATAALFDLTDGSRAKISVNGAELFAEIGIDEDVPEGACLIHGARSATARVAINGAAVELASAGEAVAE